MAEGRMRGPHRKRCAIGAEATSDDTLDVAGESTPRPPFGHLLPQGEKVISPGLGGYSRTRYGFWSRQKRIRLSRSGSPVSGNTTRSVA